MATETFCWVNPPPLISASDINYLIMHLDTYADGSCNFVGSNKSEKSASYFSCNDHYRHVPYEL